jgi:hypothetical protein
LQNYRKTSGTRKKSERAAEQPPPETGGFKADVLTADFDVG